ncbi:hypothetical protein QWJ34_16720 [Saccharibacillus sp. CPCC 101409]|uniref:hypothetical protein n=1 Tax=Saccharibacillus sp. CPCC 101409 TaxID=3058041 RepID=UPI002673CA94|nr:hypothetical protein [Saccharibacillus sp. CPCC 101409]MDO3411411.1 hypothetical protein [Saccharibacillus sp. CPCC 101409]
MMILKKFALGIVVAVLASTLLLPGSAGAVKADSYYEDFTDEGESYPLIIDQGRAYVIRAYDFNRMLSLGELISGTSSAHSLALREFEIYGTKQQLDMAKKKLNDLTATANTMKSELSYMTDSSVPEIFSNYTKAINRYKAANSYLYKFYKTPTKYNFNMYLKYEKEGFDLAYTGKEKSFSEYQYYMGMALDILSLNQ